MVSRLFVAYYSNFMKFRRPDRRIKSRFKYFGEKLRKPVP